MADFHEIAKDLTLSISNGTNLTANNDHHNDGIVNSICKAYKQIYKAVIEADAENQPQK